MTPFQIFPNHIDSIDIIDTTDSLTSTDFIENSDSQNHTKTPAKIRNGIQFQ